jgi:para-nitrobenzyl esterase
VPDTVDPSMPVRSPDGRPGAEPTRAVRRFAGIAYAQAPVGALRFAPPQPLDGVSGTTSAAAVAAAAAGTSATEPTAADATTADATPIAPQNPSRLSGVMGDLDHPQSEDCLRLTVWTPGVSGPLRPVLVWLHGGAFLSGGGFVPWYDGALLAGEGDVVVVAPNYRLGAAGFLCAPGLAPGNMGLLDVEAALQWVQDHIAAFGGDPQQVTLMGQSAGAWLACAVAGRMAEDRPQVHRLVLMSAPLGLAPAPRAQAHAVSEVLLGLAAGKVAAGSPAAASTAGDAARGLDVATLLAVQDATIRTVGTRFSAPGMPPTALAPVEDGRLPGPEGWEAFLARAAARLPVLLGWTRDEMHAFHPPGAPAAEAARSGGDALFREPTLRWADAAAGAAQPAYVFRFDWAAPDNPIGACHCIELPFVFGSLEAFAAAPMLRGAPQAQLQALSARVRSAWLAFVRTGDPNAAGAAGLPTWPPHRAGTDPAVMHIDARSGANPL